MTVPPNILAGSGWIERRPDPTISQPCTCGVVFAGSTQGQIALLFAEHVDEARDPSKHELEAW